MENETIISRNGSDKFSRALKDNYDRVWKERDSFIQWVTLFAVSAMYFSICQLIDNRKAEHPYFDSSTVLLLETGVLCLFVSIASAVVYKWRWSVKYLFESLELESLIVDWQNEELGEAPKPGQSFINSPAYERMKKSIKAHVRITELLYKSSLTFFVLAFIPLFFSVFLFVNA